jgi:MHS family alpha-ketoglutarate permease-like MFS transporter
MSSQSVVSFDDAGPLTSAASPQLRAIIVGSLGNLVEWYDFYAYAAFSLFFAKAFFPAGDVVAQQLNAAVLFAGGFLMRPIGSWVFGHLADRYGRRRMLLFSILLMCFGSLLIAVAPTYSLIGTAAPVLLGFARLLQGFSLGGEYGISAAYLCEVSDERRRGFYSSFQYVTIIGGQLCAILVLLILQKVLLTTDDLYAWGWRIPFAIGAALAIIAALLRRDLHETDAFAEAASTARSQSTLRVLREHRRESLLVAGLTIGGTAAFYTYTVYMQKFLKLSVGLSDDQTTFVTAASLIFAMILQPLYGALSDKIGRRWLLIGFGAAGTPLTIPLLTALQACRDAVSAFLLIAAAWLIVSGYTATSAIVKAELFPTLARARGVGIPYALTLAIFGGTVEPIALWFKAQGGESWFYVYLTGCIAISLIVYVFMRDTMKVSAMKRAL